MSVQNNNSNECFLCDNEGDVIKFREEHLIKCKSIAKARFYHCHLYANVKLPESVASSIGYHVKCYRIFTSYKKKYLLEYEEVENNFSMFVYVCYYFQLLINTDTFLL